MLTSLYKWQNFYQVFPTNLTLSSLQTNTDTFANSADLDETARNEPSHVDLHYLPFFFIDF